MPLSPYTAAKIVWNMCVSFRFSFNNYTTFIISKVFTCLFLLGDIHIMYEEHARHENSRCDVTVQWHGNETKTRNFNFSLFWFYLGVVCVCVLFFKCILSRTSLDFVASARSYFSIQADLKCTSYNILIIDTVRPMPHQITWAAASIRGKRTGMKVNKSWYLMSTIIWHSM